MAVSSAVGFSHRVLRYVAGVSLMCHDAGDNRFLLTPKIRETGVTWKAKPFTGAALHGVNYGSYGWSDGRVAVSWDSTGDGVESPIFYRNAMVYYQDGGADNVGLLTDLDDDFTETLACWVVRKWLYVVMDWYDDSANAYRLVVWRGRLAGGVLSEVAEVDRSDNIALEDYFDMQNVSQSPDGLTTLIFRRDAVNEIALSFDDDGNPLVAITNHAQPNTLTARDYYQNMVYVGSSDYDYEETVEVDAAQHIGATWTQSEDGAWGYEWITATRQLSTSTTVEARHSFVDGEGFGFSADVVLVGSGTESIAISGETVSVSNYSYNEALNLGYDNGAVSSDPENWREPKPTLVDGQTGIFAFEDAIAGFQGSIRGVVGNTIGVRKALYSAGNVQVSVSVNGVDALSAVGGDAGALGFTLRQNRFESEGEISSTLSTDAYSGQLLADGGLMSGAGIGRAAILSAQNSFSSSNPVAHFATDLPNLEDLAMTGADFSGAFSLVVPYFGGE